MKNKDVGGSMTMDNLLRWDHPIILLPIDVFIRPITLIVRGDMLCMVLFDDAKKVSRDFELPGFRYEISNPGSFKAGVQLLEYFEGKRTAFDMPIDVRGTQFRIRVWETLVEIPYGKTQSYAQVADIVNNPRAYRAVGSCCGSNPLPIVIPCHRVLASDGSLGGYGGGLQVKKALLEHELNMLSSVS